MQTMRLGERRISVRSASIGVLRMQKLRESARAVDDAGPGPKDEIAVDRMQAAGGNGRQLGKATPERERTVLRIVALVGAENHHPGPMAKHALERILGKSRAGIVGHIAATGN